ncbi:MFS transporter [Phycicoccus avicenniae]|uniref:MFS transporter n=1 Tax=Phycicoccus avicenniae TaxID=2828860 RepID=UPI003D2ACFAD
MITRYRRVLAVPALRRALLLGLLVRVPVFAGGIVITLHVVDDLGRSYGEAGVVAGAATVAIAVSGPWRGRLLDRRGLRKVVAPSLVVTALCWSVAPFVGYWWLLALATLAGLFVIPTFSIIRQAVITAVPGEDRRTAISLDAVAVELSFMAGPALGVWAATVWRTDLVLLVIQAGAVLAGVLLWVADPVLRAPDGEGEGATAPPRSSWFRPGLVLVLLGAAACTVVLGGTDIAVVAALRDVGAASSIGLVLAVWGLGSLLGGLVYGGLHRSVNAFWLLGGLALFTAPLALAGGPLSLGALAFVAGLFCAPTITATIDQVSQAVPATARGEAMGWHGSSMTAGMALGAPAAGYVIDHAGWAAGFVAIAAIGVVVALAGLLVTTTRARSRRTAPADPARAAA